MAVQGHHTRAQSCLVLVAPLWASLVTEKESRLHHSSIYHTLLAHLSPSPSPLASPSLSPSRPGIKAVLVCFPKGSPQSLRRFSPYTLPVYKPSTFTPSTFALPQSVYLTSVARLIHSLSQLARCLYSTHALKRASPRAKTDGRTASHETHCPDLTPKDLLPIACFRDSILSNSLHANPVTVFRNLLEQRRRPHYSNTCQLISTRLSPVLRTDSAAVP